MYKKLLLILSVFIMTLIGISTTSYSGTAISGDSQILSLNNTIVGAEFPDGDWSLLKVSAASIDYVCINDGGCPFDILTGNFPGFGTSPRECAKGAIVSINHDFIVMPFDCDPNP